MRNPYRGVAEPRKIAITKSKAQEKRRLVERGPLTMSAEITIGSVLAAIILLRWLKWLRGDGENEEFDWLIIALAVAAALTVAWRFLNP
jgi:hypothetical protein